MIRTLDVADTFLSIQGESAFAGAPCFFIRLAGCNLRCAYCDTPAARTRGRRAAVRDLVTAAAASGAPVIEVTGGEPLLQAGTPDLLRRLVRLGSRAVLVETNGTVDISAVPEGAVTVMDVKCPGSGESARFDRANLGRLRPADQVKFVLTDRADYEWARAMLRDASLDRRCAAVLFSPATPGLPPRRLARWLLEDRLPARLQVQLHKLLRMK